MEIYNYFFLKIKTLLVDVMTAILDLRCHAVRKPTPRHYLKKIKYTRLNSAVAFFFSPFDFQFHCKLVGFVANLFISSSDFYESRNKLREMGD